MITLAALKEHMAACEHAYQMMLEENRILKLCDGPPPEEFLDRKRIALARLDAALEQVRDLQQDPEELTAENRNTIQKTQQIVLKAMLLDRENEQLLLKNMAPRRVDIPRAKPTLDQIQRLYGKHAAAREGEQ